MNPPISAAPLHVNTAELDARLAQLDALEKTTGCRSTVINSGVSATTVI